jgi:ubiquinone/menaquinone biosynthesis C-methylase UbiE
MAETLPRCKKERVGWGRAFPHQLSWLINNPLRRLVVSPETFARRLTLSDSSRVLEIGPGSGYFSAALAARIPHGRLELFDLQPEMLAKAERRLRARGFLNVGYTVGDAGKDFPFPDSHFDVIVLACVFGEIPDHDRCLKSLRRVLSPTGALAFHEAVVDPDHIRFGTLRNLVEAQGFRFDRRWAATWSYMATFLKS